MRDARRPTDPQQALRPVRELLRALGEPQQRLRVIHIAGSKGKGSTATFCEALLRAEGLRTGLFLSPHLSDWRERFQIGGEFADEALLHDTAIALESALQAALARHPDLQPGFFDLATAAALWLFERAGVDCAVIETGIGGARDATNVVQPLACAITAIELEHCDRLGHTLPAIATEKAGIIKPGVPVVIGRMARAPAATIRAVAGRQSAPLVAVTAASAPQLPHLCGHAAINAALALECIAASGLVGAEDLAARAPAVLRATHLPARCEFVSARPMIFVDSAHTLDSMRNLSQALRRFHHRRRWVVSMKPDKDSAQLLGALLRDRDELLLTCADADYSQSTAGLRQALGARRMDRYQVRWIDDPVQALLQARERLDDDQLLCATGSVYLAGLARRLWMPDVTTPA